MRETCTSGLTRGEAIRPSPTLPFYEVFGEPWFQKSHTQTGFARLLACHTSWAREHSAMK
jgi:hypothetical protein